MRRSLPLLALLAILAACSVSKDEPWNGRFATPVVRPEHPRPDFTRPSYINLNTKWAFAYDPRDEGLAAKWFQRADVWTHKIQVPFAWEAPLSGLVPPHEGAYSLAETLKASTYRGVAWYRLALPGPLAGDAGYDWHLVFGAVDFKTTVWINGKEALTHEGGYDPFSVNLADFAGPGERVTIVLRVEDFTELTDHMQPVGKQGGVWYTRTSGIWQTVYLERRPAVYATGIHVLPEPVQKRVRVRLTLNRAATGSLDLAATFEGADAGKAAAAYDATSTVEAVLPIGGTQHWWDAGRPNLYDLALTLHAGGSRDDHVATYLGMVTVATDWLPNRSPADTTDVTEQAKMLWVNGYPAYLRCVLDQAYYPGGIYTAPSLEAIRNDLEIARSFGFNCIRQHIKSDEPLKYRLFDEMGFYVVYDIVALDILTKNPPGFEGRKYYAQNLAATMTRDRNHPSIVAWTIFNENWGLIENGSLGSPTHLADSPSLQAWVRAMVALARTFDPVRPLEDNSAGGVVKVFEHLTGDLNSFHYYGASAADYRSFLDAEAAGTYPGSPRNYVGGAVQTGAPWWNSEFASFSTLGGGDASIYCDLFGLVNEMRRQPKLTGYVLTQLTDVEFELNGLVNYDRSPKTGLCERSGVSLKDVLADYFVAFDWLPGYTVKAGSTVSVPLVASKWSWTTNLTQDEIVADTVRLSWNGAKPVASANLMSPTWVLAGLSVTIKAPDSTGDADLVAQIFDPTGKRVAANRITVRVVP